MIKYSAVIWDLDGTLLDTLVDLKNSVNYAMEQLGYPTRSLDDIRRFVGNGVRKLTELAIPGGLDNPDYEEAYRHFETYYKVHNQDNTKPYPGVVEVIEELKRRGIPQAIVSNKIDYAVVLLNDAHFKVDFAIGTQESLNRKPAPDMVFRAMEVLSLDPKTTVYIGDSEVDLATAKNAGLDCISVLWGFRSLSDLEPYNPQHTVSAPAEILEFISD